MSDAQIAGGTAAGEQEIVAGAPESPEPAAAPAAGARSVLADMGDAVDAPAAPTSWPEKWREEMTGGDATSLKLAERFGSPQAVWQKLLAQEQTIRRGGHKAIPTLPDDATEEQLSEYRQMIGVPETPDGYGIAFAPEFKPTETDNTLLQGFLADMHGRHIPPAQAKAAFDWYQSQVVRMREDAEANFQREFAQTKVELKREYGGDHLRNIKLLEELIERNPGLSEIVLANRHRKPFMQDMITIARSVADEESLFGGDGSGGGVSIDDQISAYREKSVSGKLTQAEDKKYNDLLAARIARDNRRATRGA